MSPEHGTKPIDHHIDLLVRTISNTIYQDPPGSKKGNRLFDAMLRKEGRDWPMHAHSMSGHARLSSLARMVQSVVEENIPGDMIETGVWRGGSSIMMRAMLAYLGDKTRKVYVADSFEGLPPPDAKKYPWDKGDTLFKFKQLAISREQVMENFNRYGLLDDQVVFLKGFFRDTLPALRHHSFSILRLDGDMYESTMDALSNLYDCLSPNGYCIIDDYGAIEACRVACSDFRGARGIISPIHEIDWTGVYWRKD